MALAGGGLLLGAGLVAGRRSLGALRWPAVAVAVAALAAGLLSVAPALTAVGAYGRYESLPMRLAYLALFCGAAWLGERRRTATGYLLGCGVASVEAVHQAWTHALPRPDGNLGNANLLGVLLAMALPLAADRIRTASPAARRAWLVLAALLVAGLAVSTSRSAWLGALAGLGVGLAFLAPRRRLAPVLAAGLLAVGLGAVLIAYTPLRTLNEDTGEARLGVWRDSVAAVAARPVLGWGEDAMGVVFGRFQTGDWGPGHNFDRAHSMPLDLAATQGLAGLAACAWFFGTWWVGVWRRRDVPLAGGLAGSAAAYLVWSLVNFDWAPATAAFWLLAGTAWPGREAPEPSSRRRRAPRAALAAAAAVAALALAVPPLAADVLYYLGRADAAAEVDPLQPAYQAAQGSLAGLRRAAELEDPSPATYVALGDAEARAGDQAAARAAYRRALERYPFDPAARQRLGEARAIESRRAASG